jgi:hypothetical protein
MERRTERHRFAGKTSSMYQASVLTNRSRQERTLKSKNKPSECPWCGSHRIAIVLGGMPVYIPEMESELDNGETNIGGGANVSSEPNWQCTECGAQFFRDIGIPENQPPDQAFGE